MYMPYFLRPRLRARRRSRCWKCDRPMKRQGLSGYAWWCQKCAHIVTYWTARDPLDLK